MAASAESQRRRYAEYRDLLAMTGEKHAGSRGWQHHLGSLRASTGTSRGEDYALYRELVDFLGVIERPAWVSHLDELRRTILRSPYQRSEFFKAWWSARFTRDEIVQMGSAFDSLLGSDRPRGLTIDRRAA